MAISSEDVEAIKEELREDLREEVKEELREEFSPRGWSRRDVLKMGGAALGGAALGSVGGAAGAVGPGDETLDVGGVTANTYRVADNWYGGPAGAQSELVSELGGADTGARYGADDTGAWYYWNGSSWDPIPGGGTDIGAVVPSDTTISAIADAVNSGNYIRLNPGTNSRPVYTADGSSITFDGDTDNRTVFVDARGAELGVSGTPTIDVTGTGKLKGTFLWYGGYFNGTNSPGDVACRLIDANQVEFFPELIRACEVGVYARIDDTQSEFNKIGFNGNGNTYSVVFVGNGGTAPPGSSLTSPSGLGADSFHGSDVYIQDAPDDGGYGFYNDVADVYNSRLDLNIFGSNGATGWRLSSGRYANTTAIFFMEQTGGASGSTGIEVADVPTRPPQLMAHFSSVGTDIVNSTGAPLVHWRPTFQAAGGGGSFGSELYHDNDLIWQWSDNTGDPGLTMAHRIIVEQPASGRFIEWVNSDTSNSVLQATANGSDEPILLPQNRMRINDNQLILQQYLELEQATQPTAGDTQNGDSGIYTSDGTDGNAAGDLVYWVNDAGTILTSVISARASAT